MFLDFIRLEHIIKPEMGLYIAYAILLYILFYCVRNKFNSENIFSSGSYNLIGGAFAILLLFVFNQILSSTFFDSPNNSFGTLPSEEIVLADRYSCRTLTNYFVLHTTPNIPFVRETLVPFLANKNDFSFLALVQKYVEAHPNESDDTLLNFIVMCNREFQSHISLFYFTNHYIPNPYAFLWEDLDWYFYIHGVAPSKEFYDLLFNYLVFFGPEIQDLVDKYLNTCSVPSQRYIAWLKSLNPLPTIIANDPRLAEALQDLPRIKEFNAYLKPLIGDKYVPLGELHSYLKVHPKEQWSEKFVLTLIDYMTSAELQPESLKSVYFDCHTSPNREFIENIAKMDFFDYIAKNMKEYPIYVRQRNEIKLIKELDDYLKPFIGDKVVNHKALYFYVLVHYEDRNPEFVRAFINYMTAMDEIPVETIVKQYTDMHKVLDSAFLEYLRKANFFEETLANDPLYPVHRTNLASLRVNVNNYNNWLSTDLVENPNFFMKLVFFSYVLFMLALCGLVVSRVNLVIFLLFTELIIFCSVFLLIVVSQYLELPFGQVYALLLLGVAAAEAAVGLGLLLVVYRIRGHLTFK